MIRPLVAIGALIVLSAVKARYEDGGRESYEHEDHYSYGPSHEHKSHYLKPSYESHYAYHDNRPHHDSYDVDHYGGDAYSVEPSYTYEPKSRPTYKQPHDLRKRSAQDEMGVREEQVLAPLGIEREGLQRSTRRIQSIVTKTGLAPNGDTNSPISFSISGEAVSGTDECKCKAKLDDIPRDDFKKGAVDVFGKIVLQATGDCYGKICNGRPIVTLENKGSDSWYVEWVEIKFDDGSSCRSKTGAPQGHIAWLDDKASQNPISCCEESWTGTLC